MVKIVNLFSVSVVIIVQLYFNLVLSYDIKPNILDRNQLTFSKNLEIFKDCLILWKQFKVDKPMSVKDPLKSTNYPWFLTLKTSVFSKTPFILKYAAKKISSNVINMNLNVTLGHLSQITKHSICHVFFHEIHFYQAHPYYNLFVESNPDFVIYFSNKFRNKNFNVKTLKKLKKQLTTLNYSAVPMYLDTYGEIQVINYMKNRISLHSLPNLINNTSILKSYWERDVQTKFHGLIVTTIVQKFNPQACDNSKYGNIVLKYDKQMCALESSLNISIVYKPNSNLGTADFYPELIVVQATINSVILSKNQMRKYQYSVSTMEAMPYWFIIIDNNIFKNNFKAITKPFQVNVWLCFLSFVLVTPLVFIVTSNNSLTGTRSLFQIYFEWSTTIIAYTIRQCKENVEKYLKRWQCSGMWLIWNFASLILSSCYDGQFLSFLATMSFSESPNNLFELSESKVPIVTISYNRKIRNFTQTIHSSVVEQLSQEYVNGYRDSKKLINLPLYYNTLASNIHFIGSSTKSFEMISKELEEFGNGKNKKFALMDKDDYVKFYGSILEINLGSRVIKRKIIQEFSSWKGWLMRRYIAYNRIDWVIWQTFEGGFQLLWDINHQVNSQLFTTKQLQQNRSIRNIIAFLVDRAKGVNAGLVSIRGPQALPISTFWIIVQAYLILTGVSIGWFLVEQFYIRICSLKGLRTAKKYLAITKLVLWFRIFLNIQIWFCLACLECCTRTYKNFRLFSHMVKNKIKVKMNTTLKKIKT